MVAFARDSCPYRAFSVIDPDVLDLRAQVETELSTILTGGHLAGFREDDLFGLRQFLGWHRLRYAESLPPTDIPGRLARFLLDCGVARSDTHAPGPTEIERRLVAARLLREPGPISLVTLQRRVATLSRVYGLTHPTALRRHAEVREALRTVTQAERRRRAGAASSDRLPTAEERSRLLATCDDSRIGVRDRALLLAWFASGTSLAMLLRLDRTALVDAARQCADAGEREAAIRAIRAWCELAKLPELGAGPVFRRVWGMDRIGAPLGPDAATRMLRRRFALAATAPSTPALLRG